MSKPTPTTESSAEPTTSPMMQQLLGNMLLTKQTAMGKKSTSSSSSSGPNAGTLVATNTLLKDQQLVLLYFSANWCPPCQSFTPLLVNFYVAVAKSQKLEIVFVSSDSSLHQFQDYYGNKMPWLAIPPGTEGAQIKTALAQTLKITGIPAMVVLETSTGLAVSGSHNARNEIQAIFGNSRTTGSDKIQAATELVQKWTQEADKISLADFVQQRDSIMAGGGGGIGDMLLRIFFAILKNPMYIFGLLYMVKYVMRKYQSMIAPDPAAVLNDVVTDVPSPTAEDEF